MSDKKGFYFPETYVKPLEAGQFNSGDPRSQDAAAFNGGNSGNAGNFGIDTEGSDDRMENFFNGFFELDVSYDGFPAKLSLEFNRDELISIILLRHSEFENRGDGWHAGVDLPVATKHSRNDDRLGGQCYRNPSTCTLYDTVNIYHILAEKSRCCRWIIFDHLSRQRNIISFTGLVKSDSRSSNQDQYASRFQCQ